eukprot:SAG31_NODE_406_length_16063_cov_22.636056_7_plen_424_part_00
MATAGSVTTTQQVIVVLQGQLERRERSFLRRWQPKLVTLYSNGAIGYSKNTSQSTQIIALEQLVDAAAVSNLEFTVTDQTGMKTELRAYSTADMNTWVSEIKHIVDGLQTADRPRPRSIGDKYAFGEQLGEGVAGHVHRGINKMTGQEVAIKTIDKRKFLRTERAITTTKREINIMRRLSEMGSHPHVVNLYDVFESPDSIFIVMELVDGGQLFDRVIERGSYSETQAATVTYILASTLDYMHAIGILHRDLKPENILLTRNSDTNIKLIDFGMSNIKDGNGQFISKCGTPVYMAPEMFDEHPKYNESVDVWAVGVLLYIMLSGALPFYSDDPTEFAAVLKDAEANLIFHDEDWVGVSEPAKTLIRKILVSDPTQRLSTTEVMADPWVLSRITDPITGRSRLQSGQALDRRRLHDTTMSEVGL